MACGVWCVVCTCVVCVPRIPRRFFSFLLSCGLHGARMFFSHFFAFTCHDARRAVTVQVLVHGSWYTAAVYQDKYLSEHASTMKPEKEKERKVSGFLNFACFSEFRIQIS